MIPEFPYGSERYLPLAGEVTLTGWKALPETGQQCEWSVQHLFYALKTLLGHEAETSIGDMDLKSRQQKARKWKSNNLSAWQKSHKLLWPHVDLPTLLLPYAENMTMGPSSEQDQRFFAESTIPTSMLFAAICSQITQPRNAPKFRHAASKLLYNLLKRLVSTGKVRARFTDSDGHDFNILIPTTGIFPASVLFSLENNALLRAVKKTWNKDAQDQNKLWIYGSWSSQLDWCSYLVFALDVNSPKDLREHACALLAQEAVALDEVFDDMVLVTANKKQRMVMKFKRRRVSVATLWEIISSVKDRTETLLSSAFKSHDRFKKYDQNAISKQCLFTCERYAAAYLKASERELGPEIHRHVGFDGTSIGKAPLEGYAWHCPGINLCCYSPPLALPQWACEASALTLQNVGSQEMEMASELTHKGKKTIFGMVAVVKGLQKSMQRVFGNGLETR